MAHLLIVDDNKRYSDRLMSIMHKKGFRVSHANSLNEGYRLGEKEDIDVVLLASLVPPEGVSASHLQRFRSGPTAPEVIILAENGNAAEAERALNGGAWDYIPKNTSIRNLLEPLTCLADSRHRLKPAAVEPEAAKAFFADIIGESTRLRTCIDVLGKAAKSDTNVLLQGETGTGKEMFALGLHKASHRSKNNFVVVDCAALPESLVESTLFGHEKGAFTGASRTQCGLIKQADRGTLFLDEIGELPLSLQKSFLRVLEEHRFRPVGSEKEIGSDFRLVAATNQDLDAMVEAGAFRRDLLFRLRTFSIHLPRLRERDGDLRLLVDHFLAQLQERSGLPQKEISHGFLAALEMYDWPGNVRELLHALERSMAAAQDEPLLLARHLPTHIRLKNLQNQPAAATERPAPSPSLDRQPFSTENIPMSDKTLQEVRDKALAEVEKRYLRQLLDTCGSMKEACQTSGLSRSRLYQLLKDHDIRAAED